ncbi:MAG: hypothetical protein JSS02_10200 [Planctomycetes bacterium]|nr:hypothetical protein [Planctomycetota bacterium]
MMMTRGGFWRLVCFLVVGLTSPLHAQVHYHGHDSPWGQRADSGPDAEVPGWYYNLGLTGLRAELVADQPRALLIKYVFPDSPAHGQVKVGDLVIGAGGTSFKADHRNGYGETVFGADGPISELALALEECQGPNGKGQLALTLRRENVDQEVVLTVGQKYGAYSTTFPGRCAKSDRIQATSLLLRVSVQVRDTESFLTKVPPRRNTQSSGISHCALSLPPGVGPFQNSGGSDIMEMILFYQEKSDHE